MHLSNVRRRSNIQPSTANKPLELQRGLSATSTLGLNETDMAALAPLSPCRLMYERWAARKRCLDGSLDSEVCFC